MLSERESNNSKYIDYVCYFFTIKPLCQYLPCGSCFVYGDELVCFCRIKSFDFWLNARRRPLGQFGGDKVILS